MPGSDNWVYEVESNQLYHIYSTENSRPRLDEQHVKLINSTTGDGFLVVEMERKLHTNDNKDRSVEEDSNPLLPSAVDWDEANERS